MRTSTQHAEPCRECGTTGGYIRHDCVRPVRIRGYCQRCYTRHQAHGAFEFDKRRQPPQACYPSHTTGEYMVWHTPDGERHAHALPFRDDYPIAAVILEAEEFAARWLDTHPQYRAKWCAPEAAAA